MVRQSPELGLMAAMIRQSITDAAGDDPVAREEALEWLGNLDPGLLARIAPGVAGDALQKMLLHRAKNPRLAKRLARVLSDEPAPKPKAGMARPAAPVASAPMVRVTCSVCGHQSLRNPCNLCS